MNEANKKRIIGPTEYAPLYHVAFWYFTTEEGAAEYARKFKQFDPSLEIRSTTDLTPTSEPAGQAFCVTSLSSWAEEPLWRLADRFTPELVAKKGEGLHFCAKLFVLQPD